MVGTGSVCVCVFFLQPIGWSENKMLFLTMRWSGLSTSGIITGRLWLESMPCLWYYQCRKQTLVWLVHAKVVCARAGFDMLKGLRRERGWGD